MGAQLTNKIFEFTSSQVGFDPKLSSYLIIMHKLLTMSHERPKSQQKFQGKRFSF